MQVEHWDRITFHMTTDSSGKITIPQELGNVVGLKPSKRVDIHVPRNANRFTVSQHETGHEYSGGYTQTINSNWQLSLSDHLRNLVKVSTEKICDIYVSDDNRSIVVSEHKQTICHEKYRNLRTMRFPTAYPRFETEIHNGGFIIPTELLKYIMPRPKSLNTYIYDKRRAYMAYSNPLPNHRLLLTFEAPLDYTNFVKMTNGALEYLQLKPHDIVRLYPYPLSNPEIFILSA